MNYKEKYKQALERAKGLLEGMDEGDYFASSEDIENIFPELKEKENEDERIRKGLIKAVSGVLKGNNLYGTDVTREEALAWLEKQGEQKPTENAKKLDANKVIKWLNDQACLGWLEDVEVEKVVEQFKKDFGL